MPTESRKTSTEENIDSDSARISWHPAFVEALQMELQEYQDVLEFHPEYQLTSEPLRIDCVVIKKAKDVVIKKNIAAIFREWNLLEYKSPEDYVSVADFYKVYGYACLYASFNKVPITDLTISFVESRYPKKLLAHLKNERGYDVAETGLGIYTVSGDILPIQVIDSRKLSAEENLWLKSLSNRLKHAEFSRVNAEIKRQGKAARLSAYLYVIAGENDKAMKEEIKMKNRFDQVIEETGLAAKWEARGEARGEERKSFSIAQNMVKLGLPIETVISATQLDPEKVKPLYQQ
ncbi:hypothetical protein R84B8_00253 [Treponema sp. R8-4-B8]